MTENEAKEVAKKLRNKAELFKNSGFAVDGIVKSFEDSANAIETLSEAIQQCREYKEIFENHFSEESLKLLSDKEEFGKWLERGRWIAKKCDEINRELEQYRAIGTVEQLEWCKDASHWKELFKEKLEKYEAIGTVEDIQEVMALCKSLQETMCKYMDIGTIEEFQALKEKSEPKKPIIHGLGQRYCPVCKCGGADHFYCARCGQKLG